MKVLSWGLLIFCLAFFIHLLIWKIRIPRGQTKLLLKIFFSVLVMSLFSLKLAASFNPDFARYAPEGFLAYIHIALFVLSLALVYIATYSAIEADSPSLVMVMNIAGEGLEGLSKEGLMETITDDLLIKPRIRDLVNAKLIYLDSGRYKVSKKGVLFIYTFILYRKLINLPKGG